MRLAHGYRPWQAPEQREKAEDLRGFCRKGCWRYRASNTPNFAGIRSNTTREIVLQFRSLRHRPEGPVLSSHNSVVKCAELARRGGRSLYIAVGASGLDCSLRPIFLWSSVLPSKSTDFWRPIFSPCLRTCAPDKFELLSLDVLSANHQRRTKSTKDTPGLHSILIVPLR